MAPGGNVRRTMSAGWGVFLSSVSGWRVSLMTGVEVRNAARSGTSNSWMTVPMRPLLRSRTTILAW